MATKSLSVQQPPLLKEALPTMYDLPSEEVGQAGMPDIFHEWQARLLDETFRPPNYGPDEIFTAIERVARSTPHSSPRRLRPRSRWKQVGSRALWR